MGSLFHCGGSSIIVKVESVMAEKEAVAIWCGSPQGV